MYETDDDVAGYDIVIVDTRDAQSAYTMSLVVTGNASVASKAGVLTVVATAAATSTATPASFTYTWSIVDDGNTGLGANDFLLTNAVLTTKVAGAAATTAGSITFKVVATDNTATTNPTRQDTVVVEFK